MRYLKLLICTIFCYYSGHCQTYKDSILSFQRNYFKDLTEEPRLSFEPSDSGKINFFPIDATFRVAAQFTRIIDTSGFIIKTHSGQEKKHFVYGSLTFKIKKKKHQLYIYQSASLMSKEGFEDYLFLPITDLTSGKESYGGGRYLDFTLGDIVNNILVIDFNKLYNPYCAFGQGFNCPIPPKENFLSAKIKAGERAYTMPE